MTHPSVPAMWEKYLDSLGDSPTGTAKRYTAWHFTNNEPGANELAALVLAGVKRATASTLWAYKGDEPVPAPGDLSLITDWVGRAQCIIQTTRVAIVPFAAVGAEFARTEGEGDGSLDYWRQVHTEYFAAECARLGREFTPKMPVVCEEFTVVYR